jgi:hypothetical protein
VFKRLLVLLVAALPLLAVAGYAAASSERSVTAEAVAATAAFHDFEAAQAAGYTVHVAELSGATCIDNGAAGAMGDHFANLAEVGDGEIDATEPEALLYEQRNDGSFKLVALEYLVFKEQWDAAHSSPPSLFGRTFDLTTAPNRFGLPAYYSLHAWIWKPNPSGLLSAWNPRVSCGTS